VLLYEFLKDRAVEKLAYACERKRKPCAAELEI